MDDGDRFVDAILLADLNSGITHGSYRSRRTIGIEHHNVISSGWAAARDETMTGAGAARRPQDQNRYFEMSGAEATAVGWGNADRQFQTLEEEQYCTQILMLRQLCIEHRIPRVFFGTSWQDRLRRYVRWRRVAPRRYVVIAHPATAPRREDLARITNARGIVRHSNVHRNKQCPGGGTYPVGANKVWHGGIHLSPPESAPFIYAAASGTVVAARVSSNSATDVEPGFGSLRFVLIRHAVYSQLEVDVDGPPSTGAYDPIAQRIKYTDANANWGPPYTFTLYMHLDALANLYSDHDENPRWYNRWLRDRAEAQPIPLNPEVIPPQNQLEPLVGLDGDRGRVFHPNVEVSVGDVLGVARQFAKLDDPAKTERILHFEVLSHVIDAVVLDGSGQLEDMDNDHICDVAQVENLLNPHGGATAAAAQQAAPYLRHYRIKFLSVWSWSKRQFVQTVGAELAEVIWPHVYRMTWMDDALAANPDLATQLGNTGFVWHYHPIFFMQRINALIRAENREFAETKASQDYDAVPTNVEVDDDNFLTQYFAYDTATNNWSHENADGAPVMPFAGSDFHFTRLDLACRDSIAAPPPPHNPADSPLKETKFALALLEILERNRVRYDRALTIEHAHICLTHVVEARCFAGRGGEHFAGVAVDLRDAAGNTQARVANLWREVGAVCAAFNTDVAYHGSTSCIGTLPAGFDGVEFHAQNAAMEGKLDVGTPLSAAELAGFRVHLGLRAAAP